MSFPKQILILALFLTLSLAVFPVKAQEEGGVSDVANPDILASLQDKLNQILVEISNLQQMLAQISASGTTYYYLNFSKDWQGTGRGIVRSSPSGINCGVSCSWQSARFSRGTTVTLTATPESGSVFVGWSGACYGKSPTCSVTMNYNQNVVARFDKAGKKKLEVFKAGQGFGTVTSSQPYNVINCGSVCTALLDLNTRVVLQAKPVQGYRFSMWLGCDSVSGSSCTLTMNDDRQVTAYFEPQSYRTYSVNVHRTGGSKIRRIYSVPKDRPRGIDCGIYDTDCTGEFYEGIEVELIPEAYSGVSWSRCDSTKDYGRICVLRMNSDKYVYVSFN
jgi:hypothetical protein